MEMVKNVYYNKIKENESLGNSETKLSLNIVEKPLRK